MPRRIFMKAVAGMGVTTLGSGVTRPGIAIAANSEDAMSANQMSANLPKLPAGFIWGASTSAYQIEGAVNADGRRPSVWDVFAHQPGRIANGDTGDVACDHYHRYPQDIDLLTEAGLQAYRFSIAWPRVIPEGRGAVNAVGLDFYDRLTDRLLQKGVEPWACLYHWDLPQALQMQGGWTKRDIVGAFTDYANVVVKRLGDRIKHWAMLNEPSVHAIFGHAIGTHAPGLTGWDNYVAAQHHQNLAQGMAIAALRAAHPNLLLGAILSIQPAQAATDRDIDKAAAIRFDAVWNRANLDPLFKGQYPDVLATSFAPLMQTGDLDLIKQRVDFLGINYYGRAHVRDDPNSVLSGAGFGPPPNGVPLTSMGWPVEPDGLTDLLLEIKESYGNPITYVMENGACYDDPVEQNGQVADPARAEFIRLHAEAAARAIAQGCALKGYFVWSLLDNFEWAEGMRRRFGIVHVDFKTQRRTPKLSYKLLAALAKQQA